jgi:hypothetical protein
VSIDVKEAQVKFFTPDASWTWYLVKAIEEEFGTFSLSELQSVRGKLGLPVKRDKFFKPTLHAPHWPIIRNVWRSTRTD